MADATITYKSTGSGSKSYSAYASDSCNNKDYGQWYWKGDAADKGQNYVLGTAGLTFSQSNGKFTLTGPTNGNAPNFSLIWKSSKVSTTYTVDVVFKIPVPLFKKVQLAWQHGIGFTWDFWLSEAAKTAGVKPTKVKLSVNSFGSPTYIRSSCGCMSYWTCTYGNITDSISNNTEIVRFEFKMSITVNETTQAQGCQCFVLASVAGPGYIDQESLPTNRMGITLEVHDQTIDGTEWSGLSKSLAGGIAWPSTDWNGSTNTHWCYSTQGFDV